MAKLQLASGGAVEPFWNTYRTHLTSPAVAAMLEKRRIGTLVAEAEDLVRTAVADDPYVKEDAPRRRRCCCCCCCCC